MDKHKIHIKEILDLTLEIIYLLTREDYTVVKKTSGDGHYPNNMTPSYSAAEENTNEKILDVTKRIIRLLTGEGWDYIREREDPYKDQKTEIQQICTSPDGSRNRNPPERCPRPLDSRDSMQEGHSIPHHHQVQESLDVKFEGKEEDVYVMGGPHATDVKIKVTIKEERVSSELRAEENLNCDLEDNSTGHDCPEENLITRNTRPRHHGQGCSPALSNIEEPFPDTVSPATLPGFHKMDRSRSPNLEETSPDDSQVLCQENQPKAHNEARPPAKSKHEESPSDGSENDSQGLCDRSLGSRIPEEHLARKSEKDESGPSGSEKGQRLAPPSNLGGDLNAETDTSPSIRSDRERSSKGPEEPDRHRKSRSGTKPYSCSDCGKRFPVRSKLIQHLRVHTGEKPFSCATCGRCFTTKTNLSTHQSIHTEDKPFPCPECGKRFSRRSSLLTHLRIHNSERDFACGECGKSFTLKCYLRIHEKIHTGEKPFSCPECGKRFLQRSAYVKHQRLHRGDKPFPCPECGRCFLEKGQLAVHRRIHTGERPYACSECYKSFVKKSDLQRHQRTHTGERPFSCGQCGKCFTQKAHLVAHLRVHSGEKPASCSECGRCSRTSLSGQNREGHTH